MGYLKYTLMVVILILAASVAWAQLPTTYMQFPCAGPCEVAEVACPQPCPVVTQAPCPAPQECPQVCPPVCPCPAAVPAAIGAGPAADLQGVVCPNFDPAYAAEMYQQNATIIAVTAYGMQRAHDKNLRDISGEINGYLTSADTKLQGWYGATACAQLTIDCTRAEAIIAELCNQPDECFDAVYARTLSELLRQSDAAETLAASQTLQPDMRAQAQFLSEKESNWTMRLDRWVSEHAV